MKSKIHLLISFFVINFLLASTCFSYYIINNKAWVNTNTKYYSMSSSFSTASKTAFSNANIAWNNVSGKPFSIYRSTTDNTATDTSPNSCNEVVKVSNGIDGIPLATYTWTNSDHKVIEFDIEVNASYPWSNDGSPNFLDVQNCAAHEIGHALFSDDSYVDSNSENTMYGYTSLGETKKEL